MQDIQTGTDIIWRINNGTISTKRAGVFLNYSQTDDDAALIEIERDGEKFKTWVSRRNLQLK